ncbi:MAG TPA: DUF4232 domain-containing protein [Trebonia sp.]|nr:DUF4232 domain-containing protein [Trebonia sp.]
MKPWLRLAAGTVLAGAVLAGCGTGGSGTATESRTASPGGSSAGSATPAQTPATSGTSATASASAAAPSAAMAACCALDGYPGLRLLNSRHQVLHTVTHRGSTLYANDPGRRLIDLAPGQTARASLAWTPAAAR